MLQIKFFSVNGNYYVKARHNGNVVDTTALLNIWEHTADYIKTIMNWGYARNEIEFVIDPTIESDVAESINYNINIYATV